MVMLCNVWHTKPFLMLMSLRGRVHTEVERCRFAFVKASATQAYVCVQLAWQRGAWVCHAAALTTLNKQLAWRLCYAGLEVATTNNTRVR